jgi:hypothetical protein
MLPSLFSLMPPATPYQWLFAVYCYVMPILLYGAWAAVSLMDMFDSPRTERSAGWALAVLLVPLAGGATYLLARAFTLTVRARYAMVVGGLLVWLIPLAYGLAMVWGPLGPKALN